ncbi:uncharacterized protein LOC127259992 [Andrographis paniculata]|uniref:uncharacterized protein LOC127259992 n=1 Tax=Andrographis paniculata TaxID=175694 RepID=UPI0021E87921|nr:uncharacterized protein LOC127259992 [Andrographis paniculata]
MSEVNEPAAWRGQFDGLIDESVGRANGYSYSPVGGGGGGGGGGAPAGDWRFQLREFAKGAAEMSVAFGKGVRDVVKQSVLKEDSLIVRKFKGPCATISKKLVLLNEYLPEDRDPVRAWTVIASVWFFALTALFVNFVPTSTPLVKTMKTHPPSASLILLPDGRHLAFREQGVPADQARYSIMFSHSFLSSRLAGIPGLKDSLLQEFGIRLVTYDLPGFGESDPHPLRDLESSAMDILHLSYALNITNKFWVMGFSDGSKHAWAALHYIPDRIEGAIMIAPMINPYEPHLDKDERRRIWGNLTVKKRLMLFLARKFPRLLPYFYRRSFLSGNHGCIEAWLSSSLGKKDRALIEDKMFKDFWQRDVEESVRQANAKPFVEEAVLQVSYWGFSLSDLQPHGKRKAKGILAWLKSAYRPAQKGLTGFIGPVHVWHGGEDRVVPPSSSDFVRRVLPEVMLHKLPYEGHFTYLYFCDECHRQIFSIALGNPQGPLTPKEDAQPPDENDNSKIVTAADVERTYSSADEFR